MRTYGQSARKVAAATAMLGLLVTVGQADQQVTSRGNDKTPSGDVSSGHRPEIEGLPNFELSSEPTCAVHAAEQLNIPNTCGAAVTVDDLGRVGIGTNVPDTLLDVAGDSQIEGKLIVSSSLRIGNDHPGNSYLNLSVSATTGGYSRIQAIQNEGSTYGNLVLNPSGGRVGIGTNAPDTLLDVDGVTRTKILQITGGSDLAEPFDVNQTGETCEPIIPGMVVVIDPAQPGALMLASEAYDRKVAGVISGANNLSPGMVMRAEGNEHADGEHPVALTGRVWVWCDASLGSIQPGDRLTTSSTPGHAMKVSNSSLADGAVVGKAMTQLDQGLGLVLLLVQPQ